MNGGNAVQCGLIRGMSIRPDEPFAKTHWRPVQAWKVGVGEETKGVKGCMEGWMFRCRKRGCCCLFPICARQRPRIGRYHQNSRSRFERHAYFRALPPAPRL